MKKIISFLLLINANFIFAQSITGAATGTAINSTSPSRGYIPRFNTSSNIQSSIIYQYGTNIGFNTILSPSVPLHIEANSTAGYGILMNQTGTGQSALNLYNTGTGGRNWGYLVYRCW